MAKEKLTGWIHDPLTAVLGTRGKVMTLRILWRAEAAIPYREVVRRSGMAYRSIELALGELLQTGLVEELPGGRERRVRLRAGHRLAPAVATLFQVEADFFAALRVELRASAEAARTGGLVAAAITGAVARGDETLDGPLDIVGFVATEGKMARCQAIFDAAGDAIRARFGVRLNVALYDLGPARAMWRTRTPAAERNVREAEPLIGPPLATVLEE